MGMKILANTYWSIVELAVADMFTDLRKTKLAFREFTYYGAKQVKTQQEHRIFMCYVSYPFDVP